MKKIDLPKNVSVIMNKLNENGFTCFLVGGSLRNIIMGITPKDFDMTTNAKPKEILRIFSSFGTITAGIKHGTVGIVIDRCVYEVTTYRIDGKYNDNRHPEKVHFTEDLQQDLSRRDFTMNAIAYNESVGMVDCFGGTKDIYNKCIRCVGNADLRMREDALRILRAVRFASVYGFTLESKTEKAVFENKLLLKNISAERIVCEFKQILTGKYAGDVLRKYRDIIAVFIPEIIPAFDCKQNTPHHDKTVWEHIVCAVEYIENTELLRTVMFFHDICKPQAKFTDSSGRDHFKGHDEKSAKTAEEILKRLKYPNYFIKTAVQLIYYHDERFKGDIKQKKIEIKILLNLLGEENFKNLLKIQYADMCAQSMYLREEKQSEHEQVTALFEEIIKSGECYKLSQLAVSGNDLMEMGIPKGERIGKTLDILLNLVIEGKVENTYEELKKIIRNSINSFMSE